MELGKDGNVYLSNREQESLELEEVVQRDEVIVAIESLIKKAAEYREVAFGGIPEDNDPEYIQEMMAQFNKSVEMELAADELRRHVPIEDDEIAAFLAIESLDDENSQ